MIQYCQAYFKYIKTKIHLLNRILLEKNPDEDLIEKKLKEIIKCHIVAVDLVEKIDDCLNLLMLMMYISNSLNLIFLILEFSVVSIKN